MHHIECPLSHALRFAQPSRLPKLCVHIGSNCPFVRTQDAQLDHAKPKHGERVVEQEACALCAIASPPTPLAPIERWIWRHAMCNNFVFSKYYMQGAGYTGLAGQ